MNEDIPKKWVGGVCIKEDKVLLVHRINKERELNQEYFVFPGNEVADDKSIEDTLVNEFASLSIVVKLQELLYSKEETGDDDMSEYYYFCEYILGEPSQTRIETTETEDQAPIQFYTPVWMSLNELDDIMLYPESIKDELISLAETRAQNDVLDNL